MKELKLEKQVKNTNDHKLLQKSEKESTELFWKEIMGVNRPIYRRHRGAFKQMN